MLVTVSRLRQRKLEKLHAFQKKNASNKLNIFFLNKIEEEFLLETFNI